LNLDLRSMMPLWKWVFNIIIWELSGKIKSYYNAILMKQVFLFECL
jgi:hypothetical protein